MLSINAARKLDPSHTGLIRRKYEADVTSRFRRLKRDIKTSIIDKDAFGLQPGLMILRPTEPRQFDFPRSEDKVRAFMEWLQQQVDEGILEVTERDNTGRIVASSEWQNVYVRVAAERAVIQATNAITAAGVAAPLIVGNPFNQPIFADRLGLLFTRQFSLLKGITEAMSSGIANELTLGMAQGLNPKVIARNIAKKVDGIGIVRARVLAQTEVIRSHSEATLNSYQSAGIEEVEVEAEWSTAKDGRVCPTCSAREGKVYSLNEARGLIPAHPRCFPGDTLVTASDNITAISKRWYDGDVVILHTASGKRLTATINHPILTDSGWCAAHLLQIGDNVVGGALGNRRSLQVGNYQNVPARIQDVVETLLYSGKMTARPVPTSAPDFHGDGIDGQIGIIGTDSELRHGGDASLMQHLRQIYFQIGHAKSSFLTALRMEAKFLKRRFSSTRGLMGSPHLLLSLLSCHPCPFQSFSLALGSQGNASLSQAAINRPSAYAEFYADRITRHARFIQSDNFFSRQDFNAGVSDGDLTFVESIKGRMERDAQLARNICGGATGEIFFDKVISIDVQTFRAHVYNLQTDNEFYHAEGLVVHNCRCSWKPWSKAIAEAEKRRLKRAA